MGLPLDVPGLDVLVRDVPDGRVVVVEGGMDPTKGFFAQHVARSAAGARRQVTFVTSREKESVLQQMTARGAVPEGLDVVALDDWVELGLPRTGDRDIIVDSFSLFMVGRPLKEVSAHLRDLRGYCLRSGRAALLTVERGMLQPDVESVLHHLTDGIIQFHMREGSEGLQQFLRIPKWTKGEVFIQNIYYSFDGKRLLIDTRRRLT